MFPGGAALLEGRRGAVLVDEGPSRALGRALAWAERHGVAELHVLVEDSAGRLARQAASFANPPTVWWVRDRDLHLVEPEPHRSAPAPSAAVLAFATEIEATGATAVVEHGILAGDVLGLEVARVVDGPEHIALAVGIGRHDREAFAIIHGDHPSADALAGVVAAVRRSRTATSPANALYRLAQERWLREIILARPDVLGVSVLDRHEGPQTRPNLKDPWPAVVTTPGGSIESVVAVCSVGVDIDLVPYAADARATHDPGARLVLVVPERDAHPVTRALAASLREPAEVVTVTEDWRSLA